MAVWRHLNSTLRHVCRLRTVAALSCDRRGVAALEFALLAPFLLTALIGLVAISQAVRAKMLLTSTASSMASMVAAQHTVTGGSSGTLRDLCNGAQLIMRPYAAGALSIAITSYTKQSDSTVLRDWEYDGACQASAGSLAATGVTLASPLLVDAGDSIIITRASYNYMSLYTNIVPNMMLSQTAYARPRYGTVTCTIYC